MLKTISRRFGLGAFLLAVGVIGSALGLVGKAYLDRPAYILICQSSSFKTNHQASYFAMFKRQRGKTQLLYVVLLPDKATWFVKATTSSGGQPKRKGISALTSGLYCDGQRVDGTSAGKVFLCDESGRLIEIDLGREDGLHDFLPGSDLDRTADWPTIMRCLKHEKK